MHIATTQFQLLGTLWDVEIEFTYDPVEPEVGLFSEIVYVEEVWLLGYYPEGNGKSSDYVPCHIKCDIAAFTPAEAQMCEDACYEYIKKAAREAFDDSHGYED